MKSSRFCWEISFEQCFGIWKASHFPWSKPASFARGVWLEHFLCCWDAAEGPVQQEVGGPAEVPLAFPCSRRLCPGQSPSEWCLCSAQEPGQVLSPGWAWLRLRVRVRLRVSPCGAQSAGGAGCLCPCQAQFLCCSQTVVSTCGRRQISDCFPKRSARLSACSGFQLSFCACVCCANRVYNQPALVLYRHNPYCSLVFCHPSIAPVLFF